MAAFICGSQFSKVLKSTISNPVNSMISKNVTHNLSYKIQENLIQKTLRDEDQICKHLEQKQEKTEKEILMI